MTDDTRKALADQLDAAWAHANQISGSLLRPGWRPTRSDIEQARNEIRKTVILTRDALRASSPATSREAIAEHIQVGFEDGLSYNEIAGNIALMFECAALIATVPPSPEPVAWSRDELGRFVREAWIRWAQTQPNPKQSWLVPYDFLLEEDKEADRQIGEAIVELTAAPPVEREAWQPIKTAPKDGTRVLLAVNKRDGTGQCIFAAEFHFGNWRVSKNAGVTMVLDKACITEWQPMPALSGETRGSKSEGDNNVV